MELAGWQDVARHEEEAGSSKGLANASKAVTEMQSWTGCTPCSEDKLSRPVITDAQHVQVCPLPCNSIAHVQHMLQVHDNDKLG